MSTVVAYERLEGGSNVTLTPVASERKLVISSLNTTSVVSTGSGVSIIELASGTLRSIAAGTGITVTNTPAGTLTVANTGVSTLANAGSGTTIIEAATGTLRSIAAGSGITVTNSPAGTLTLAVTGTPAHSRIFQTYTSVANLGANSFLLPNGGDAAELNTRRYTSTAGTLTRLTVWLSVAPGAGETRTLTVRVGNGNGAAANTALAVSISGTATSGQTTTNVALVVNDYVTIQNTHPTNPGVADSRVYAVLDWVY